MPAATATVATVATVPRPPRPIFLHTHQHRSVWAQRKDFWSTGWLGSCSQPTFGHSQRVRRCSRGMHASARLATGRDGPGRTVHNKTGAKTWGITGRALQGRAGAHLHGLGVGRREACVEDELTSAGSEPREVEGSGLGRRT